MLVDATLLCHFFNEEHILPEWLNHHKKLFKFGVMVDYNSNDRSVGIIKKICPSWQIIQSENEFFDAEMVDQEIIKLEQLCDGWVIALNVTEFLIGDLSIVKTTRKNRLYIPSVSLVAFNLNFGEETCFELSKSIDVTESSINFWDTPNFRVSRCMHVDRFSYPIGRHFFDINQSSLIIIHVANYLVNHEMISRRLQIQDRIPPADKSLGRGIQHYSGPGSRLDLEQLILVNDKLVGKSSKTGNILKIYYYLMKSNGFDKNVKIIFIPFFLKSKLKLNFLIRKISIFIFMKKFLFYYNYEK